MYTNSFGQSLSKDHKCFSSQELSKHHDISSGSVSATRVAGDADRRGRSMGYTVVRLGVVAAETEDIGTF